jgi:hypothetical protein
LLVDRGNAVPFNAGDEENDEDALASAAEEPLLLARWFRSALRPAHAPAQFLEDRLQLRRDDVPADHRDQYRSSRRTKQYGQKYTARNVSTGGS